MENPKYKCPLCCEQIFHTKQELLNHLTRIIGNVHCPICNKNYQSVLHLIEHLTMDNCQPYNNTANENLGDSVDIISEKVKSYQLDETTEITSLTEEEVSNNDNNEVYVDMLDTEMLKTCQDNWDLKIVKEDGNNAQYTLINHEDTEYEIENTIVSRETKDGTISFASYHDVKLEMEKAISFEKPAESSTSTDGNQEEIYTCNTCGIMFTSVMEHIQNFHGDQEVVVEEPVVTMDDLSNESNAIKFVTVKLNDVTQDVQLPRRVITETGNIVEAPFVDKTTSETATNQDSQGPNNVNKKLATTDGGHTYAKRFVKVDKLFQGVVKGIKDGETEKPSGPYHKVVVKEFQTESNAKIKILHCLICNVFVSSLSEFKSYPCKTLKYSCTFCSESYDNPKSLCAHMKVHKVEKAAEAQSPKPVPYECEVCCTIFPTNKSLKLHKRMHDPIKSRPIEAPLENPDGTAGSEDKYMCKICNKMIPCDYKEIHMTSHESTDTMTCGVCNKEFSSTEYLQMHMKVHNVEKGRKKDQDESLPYHCLFCNRRFARPHEKVKHERIHTGEKPHSCEICGKSFRVAYCLTLHMRTHTGARPYGCPHCGKRFKAHSVYSHHLFTHSEVRGYKCPFCPKAFKTSVQLAGHKNSHTKPFSCQQCNRPFASLYAVRVHTEKHAHQNNLKFTCTLCGAGYARAFALKDHIKQAHEKEAEEITNEKKYWPSNVSEDLKPNKDVTQEMIVPDPTQDYVSVI